MAAEKRTEGNERPLKQRNESTLFFFRGCWRISKRRTVRTKRVPQLRHVMGYALFIIHHAALTSTKKQSGSLT